MRTLIVLLAAALVAAPCGAQQDSAPAAGPYTLLSLNVGAAAGPVASGAGRPLPSSACRSPDWCLARRVSMPHSACSGPPTAEASSGGYILDVGVAYAVPANATVSIVRAWA